MITAKDGSIISEDGWVYREVSPGYWGIVSPAGKMYNEKLENLEAVRAFIESKSVKLKH